MLLQFHDPIVSSWSFVCLRESLFFRLFQVSGAPTPHNGADHSRVKQGKFMAYGEQGPRAIKRVFY